MESEREREREEAERREDSTAVCGVPAKVKPMAGGRGVPAAAHLNGVPRGATSFWRVGSHIFSSLYRLYLLLYSYSLHRIFVRCLYPLVLFLLRWIDRGARDTIVFVTGHCWLGFEYFL